MYPHNNSIIHLLGDGKTKLSIIPEKNIKKQTSMRKSFKKQSKSIFKIDKRDKRKIQGLKSFNFNNMGNETLRDNQNI